MPSIAASRGGERCGVGREADFGDVQLLDDIKHRDHMLVVGIVGTFDHHAQFQVAAFSKAN